MWSRTASARNEARAELASFAAKEWGGRVTVHSNNVEGYPAQQRTTRLLVAVLASIGLTSAALNLMNLTLARVLTGRREVGILRSLGATRANIRGQYFTNALIMGVVGGSAGVVLGYGFLAVFNLYVATASSAQIEAVRPSLLSTKHGPRVRDWPEFAVYHLSRPTRCPRQYRRRGQGTVI